MARDRKVKWYRVVHEIYHVAKAWKSPHRKRKRQYFVSHMMYEVWLLRDNANSILWEAQQRNLHANYARSLYELIKHDDELLDALVVARALLGRHGCANLVTTWLIEKKTKQ